MVTGIGSLLAIIANPLFGRLSDHTTSCTGMRRPWRLVGLAGGAAGTLVVATAPNIPVLVAGWCAWEVSHNATLAAQTAVLSDQVPSQRSGLVRGLLGSGVPAASVAGTYLVQAFTYSTVLTFAAPCAVGGAAVLLSASRLPDRRLALQERPATALWTRIPATVRTGDVRPCRRRDVRELLDGP